MRSGKTDQELKEIIINSIQHKPKDGWEAEKMNLTFYKYISPMGYNRWINMEMISVQQAEEIVLSQYQDYGKESISYDLVIGRVLAEDILADRDLPFDRPTVDGIAIRFTSYEEGFSFV